MRLNIVLFFFAAVLFSCNVNKTAEVTVADAGTKVYSFKDSCEHLVLSLSLELPLGNDSASMLIRDSLVAEFCRGAEQPGYQEEGSGIIKPYSGEKEDYQALVDYYGKADYDTLLHLAQEDYKYRIEFLENDTTMAEEDKESIRNDVPQWAFDYNVGKIIDANSFVVYNSQVYIYLGGAHGGVGGTGAMTFDKKTGYKIEDFINADAAKDMQKLIRKGLLNYYSEAGDTINDQQLSERLQIQGTIVPLPTNEAYPNATGDSLIFTYGQYEIACYADGMPSFALAVNDLTPYLTPKAKALLIATKEETNEAANKETK